MPRADAPPALDLCDDAADRLTTVAFIRLAQATARILLVAGAADVNDEDYGFSAETLKLLAPLPYRVNGGDGTTGLVRAQASFCGARKLS